MIPAVEVIKSGLMPMPRQILPGYDSGVLLMTVAVFVLTAVSFTASRRLWHSFFRGLTHSGPAVSAAESAETTTGERWALAASLAQTFVCEGLLIFAFVHYRHLVPLTPALYFRCAAVCTLLCAALYQIQRAGYAVTAYTFAPHPATDRRSWLRAFAATQSMLGVALLVPALGALFYPMRAMALLWTAAALYITARILFIIKGFRIFYENGFSVFYFFLYLCTLEILPLVALAAAVAGLSAHIAVV